MTSRLTAVIIDCHHPRELAEFWCEVLNYRVVEASDDAVEISPGELPDADLLAALRAGPFVPTIQFERVPESKVFKNRVHLDVSPIDSTQDEEVLRLLRLGASRADSEPGEARPWVVMLDPEGNEFCVLRSLAPGVFSL